MTTKEIIAYILNREDVSSAAFAKNIGVHPTQVYDLQSGKTKKISSGVGNKIINRYPDYNLTWLLTGEGEMLKGDTTQDKPTSIEAQHKSYFKEERDIMVPLIHIDSVGGVHSQNLIESSEQYVEQWIPLPDARPGSRHNPVGRFHDPHHPIRRRAADKAGCRLAGVFRLRQRIRAVA